MIARLLTAFVSLPPQPVGRPARQEQRDDPCQRTPPARNPHFRLRGLGSARPATDDARPRAPAAAWRAAPRPASGSSRRWVGQSRSRPPAETSAAARGPPRRFPRPRAATAAKWSSTGAPPRRSPLRAHRAAGPPPCRPASFGRRRPRHRSPGREQGRPGPTPVQRGLSAPCTRAPCLSCARQCRRRRAPPRRHRSRRCRHRQPHAAHRAPSHRQGGGDPPRLLRRQAPRSSAGFGLRSSRFARAVTRWRTRTAAPL